MKRAPEGAEQPNRRSRVPWVVAGIACVVAAAAGGLAVGLATDGTFR